ncbi:cadmium resistance transporter [Amycolatopsis suaedae]|uniref:Cadmium transporter n=1 Tax=Amycolatopsis suaedae TaxID=2510978 RepID=A0A4Q7JBY7_9PSEU|nr:cadmium resistance transporter [Amycolatopsis suaedae]RZQ64522.1 cadmium transporter [Amycolatopsis suaedae]
MDLALAGQAVGMFAVTNVDDIVLLALYFGRSAGRRCAIVAGQYLGFAGILAISVAGALGARLLPDEVLPYLGALPLLLGILAAWRAWRDRGADDEPAAADGPALLTVAAVTFANGGDNIGVYVPVFANAGTGGMLVYTGVFLVLVGVWCALGRFLATRRPIASALTRWGHVALPVVLIAIGVLILAGGF